jgi:5-amino-6-(5-phosphoribosylamino)uracil reductase
MLWPIPPPGHAGRAGNPPGVEPVAGVDGVNGPGDLGHLADVHPAEVYGADSRHPVGDRPWVLANMIASIDGAATDLTGRSAGLGGPADLRVFSAIRAVADIVLAGAGTVRTERYGPARLIARHQEARRGRGQSRQPRIAVVTRSLALDLDLPLFRDASDEHRPIVITTTAGLDRVRVAGATGATPSRDLATVAEIVVAGDQSVDWGTALRALRTTARAGVVLVEGGPMTLAQLVAADLVDELCLTVSPRIIGGDGLGLLRGLGVDAPRHMTLDRVLLEDDYLFLRYLRARDGA